MSSGVDRSAVPDHSQQLRDIARLARQATVGTVPDAIRRCRRLAAAHEADGFALFFAGRGSGPARLTLCFDHEFPGISPLSSTLLDKPAEVLSRHALRSALPGRWSDDVGEAETLVATLPRLLPDHDGLVLPVSAESGLAGLFVFVGSRLAVAGARLLELHRAGFDMFAQIAALRSGSSVPAAAAISKRELECLRLTAAGRTSEDIARILGLSIHTANQYLTSASAKLDAVSRMQAVAKAIRLGLID